MSFVCLEFDANLSNRMKKKIPLLNETNYRLSSKRDNVVGDLLAAWSPLVDQKPAAGFSNCNRRAALQRAMAGVLQFVALQR